MQEGIGFLGRVEVVRYMRCVGEVDNIACVGQNFCKVFTTTVGRLLAAEIFCKISIFKDVDQVLSLL